MRRRSQLTVAGTIVLFGLATGWLLIRHNSLPLASKDGGSNNIAKPLNSPNFSEPNTSSSAPSAERTQRKAGPADPKPNRRLEHTGSLSTLDSDLAPQLDDLKAKASDGNAEAAVQLWYGLQQCNDVTSERLLEWARNDHSDSMSEGLVKANEKILDYCKDVPASDVESRYRWLKSAAEQGNAQAQLFYALAGTSALGGINEALRDPAAWSEYQDTAKDYLDSLVKQCDTYAIGALMSAYNRGTQLYPRDESKYYQYRYLTELVEPLPQGDPALAPLRDKLSPIVADGLEREAQSMYNSYCK